MSPKFRAWACIAFAVGWLFLGNFAAASVWTVAILFLPLLDDRDRRLK